MVACRARRLSGLRKALGLPQAPTSEHAECGCFAGAVDTQQAEALALAHRRADARHSRHWRAACAPWVPLLHAVQEHWILLHVHACDTESQGWEVTKTYFKESECTTPLPYNNLGPVLGIHCGEELMVPAWDNAANPCTNKIYVVHRPYLREPASLLLKCPSLTAPHRGVITAF